METAQIAIDARSEIDGLDWWDDPFRPGQEHRGTVLGQTSDLCPCGGRIEHDPNLPESGPKRCIRFWDMGWMAFEHRDEPEYDEDGNELPQESE
jgi:hypothetical protein